MEPIRNGNARIGRLEALVEVILRDIAEIRADMKELRKEVAAIRTVDFRILIGMIIALGLGMGGVMAKGFGWI